MPKAGWVPLQLATVRVASFRDALHLSAWPIGRVAVSSRSDLCNDLGHTGLVPGVVRARLKSLGHR